MTPARLLVTGASGFLGRHLLQALRTEWPDAAVSALVRSAAAWRAAAWTRAHPEVTLVEGRLADVARWGERPEVRALDVVIHMAATVQHRRTGDPTQGAGDVEAAGAMVRLAARSGARMVHLSTSGTVGCSRDPAAAPDEFAPFSSDAIAGWPYYVRKVEAERSAREIATRLGVTLVILRPPVLLGPEDHRGRSTQHVRRLLAGTLPFVVRGGIHYADVRDVATAIVRAARTPSPQPVYNLPGTSSSLAAFFALVAEVAGRQPPRLVLPAVLGRAIAWMLRPLHLLPDPVVFEMAAHHWGMGSRYAFADLGYRSRPARETIADTVTWLRAVRPS